MSEERKLTIGQAVDQLVSVLESLDAKTRSTVLAIVCAHLGINGDEVTASRSEGEDGKRARPAVEAGETQLPKRKGHIDVRTLKADKKPGTAIEMAAIVAFYLKEHAPSEEQQTTVGKDDIEKYFKQASFRLPNRIGQLLPDAKAAGYFDSAERGRYKLNAVGYNLVAHSLPRASRAE
jgi:hypothetical protein